MDEGRFGPNTPEVERVLELGGVAAGLPPVMWFFSQHYESDWTQAAPIRERARAIAESNGLGAAWEAAYGEAYESAYSSTHCAAEDATFAAGFTAQAVVVRHLLEPADFDALYHHWGDVFGPPSSASVEEEPPAWPPAIVFGEPCGKRPCIHGAARPKTSALTRLRSRLPWH